MNAVVLGNGRSGKAAAALLACEGWQVCVLDGDDAWPSGACDLCVTSPGVPLDHPWQIAARAAGVRVVSELQIGAERYREMGGKMFAVTGSKGKSSVVKLVADALDGIPCGNYGKPLCEVVLECFKFSKSGSDPKKDEKNIGNLALISRYRDKLPFAVVEVSSFQMETTDLPPDTFEAAAVLNLQEDHLDRHGTVEVYHSLKKHLLDFAVLKLSTDMGRDPWKSERNDNIRWILEETYFDNPVLADNGRCAVELMRAAGLGDAEIREAFLRFEALPHRMQTIGVCDGVRYIDDSKATSIAAMIAGVTMAASYVPDASSPGIRLIAGGQAKGDDPLMARASLAEHVLKVYLIGQCASAFSEAWKDVVPCEVCGTLETAVATARRESRKGDVVLLSPGTASFDQFGGYGERGDLFRYFAGI